MDWISGKQGGGIGSRTYILAGLLLVTLLGVHSLDAKQKAARARARAVAAAALPPPAAALAARNRDAYQNDIPAGWGRDPFGRTAQDAGDDDPVSRSTPSARPTAGGTGLYLQGIMVGPTGRTALINGDVVREGERVGPYEVLSIGKRTVLLILNGSVTTLALKGDGS